MRCIFGSLILLAACAAQAQGLVKCEDQNGKILYVDRPCSLYGLRDAGPIKDRATVAPPQPATAPAEAPAATAPGAAEEPAAPRTGSKPRLSARERAAQRCKRSRGVDCETDAGLLPWMNEDKPLSEEDRQAAIGARRLRERCEKTQYSTPDCERLKFCDSIQNTAPECPGQDP